MPRPPHARGRRRRAAGDTPRLRHGVSRETRRGRLALLTALALGVLLGSPLDAQPSVTPDPVKPLTQFRLEVWQVAEGLPQNTVMALAQTRTGYLWVGSQEGLARYNGHQFRIFDEGNTPAFEASETVWTVLEDAGGDLWVGTRRGLVLLDGRSVVRMMPHVLGEVDIHALAQTPDGALWVGSNGAGLWRCQDGECASVMDTDSLLDSRVFALEADTDGALWVGTERGLVRWHNGTVRLLGPAEGLPDPHVLSIAPARDGGLWVGTRAGLARVRTPAGAPPTLEAMPPVQGWPRGQVLSLLEDAAGALWIGLDQEGLLRHYRGRFDSLGVGDGLPNGRVKDLLIDREGSLWLGIENGGLARLRDGAFSTLTAAEGLTGDVVLTVYEDPRGRLWAGTFDGGLTRLRRRGLDLSAAPERRFEKAVSSLAGRGRDLWVGTLGEGLHRRRDADTWRAFGTDDGLPSPNVFALYVGTSGELWVGTDLGLARYTGGRFSTLTVADGLSSDVITTVLETRDGALWVGTYDGGLNRYADGEITTFGADLLGSDVVTALYEDPEGTLWVATYGGGLARYADGAFFRYTSRHGLYDDKLYQVFEDGEGHLWMGCNKGIFRVAKDELAAVAAGRSAYVAPVVYDEDDGLRSREVNGGVQPAGWASRDGRLWFPTTAGLAFVDPSALRRNSTPPPVVIEEVRVERAPVALPAEGPLRVPPGTDHIDFDFAALSLADPGAVRYRYRLDGFETAWSNPTDRRVASYTRLDPGRYTFRVIAMNADGVWNEAGAAVALDLRPFFWQTTWFWLLVGVVAAGAGTGAYRLRVRHLTRRQRELEREVAARTRALRDALDEKEVLLREIHHRVKNNLQIISSLLHLQAQKSDDAAALALFREARSRVHAMAMIHERLYRSDNLARLDFGLYLRSVVDQLSRSYTLRSDLTLDVRADPVPMEAEQAIPLGLIANELVSNALKHALADEREAPPRLHVTFERVGAGHRLAVEDNGPGLPDGFEVGQGRSLGLKLVRALAAKLGGTLRTEPPQHSDGGARFVLEVPADPLSGDGVPADPPTFSTSAPS